MDQKPAVVINEESDDFTWVDIKKINELDLIYGTDYVIQNSDFVLN